MPKPMFASLTTDPQKRIIPMESSYLSWSSSFRRSWCWCPRYSPLSPLHRKSRLFRSSSNRGKAGGDPSYNLLLAKQRVIQLLFMIVSIFIICWGPASVGYLLYNVGAISPSYLYGPIYSLLFLLAFWNSCLNPLIYTIRQPKFRNAIRELFICKKPQDNDIF